MPLTNKIDEFYEDLKRLRNFDEELKALMPKIEQEQISESTLSKLPSAVKYEAESVMHKYAGIGSPEKEYLAVMATYFGLSGESSKSSQNETYGKTVVPVPQEKYLDTSVEELGLRSRTLNALKNQGIKNVGELLASASKAKNPLNAFGKGVGKYSLEAINRGLQKFGYVLGDEVEYAMPQTGDEFQKKTKKENIEALAMPIYKINLTPTKIKALADYFAPSEGGYIALGDIVKKSRLEILKAPGFGARSTDKLEKIVGSFGFKLGQNVEFTKPSGEAELNKESDNQK